jgi:hypothetical protein
LCTGIWNKQVIYGSVEKIVPAQAARTIRGDEEKESKKCWFGVDVTMTRMKLQQMSAERSVN